MNKILGINFFNGLTSAAVEIGLAGGLVVVPSAPVLVEMEVDLEQRTALLSSDLAIPDSSLMVYLAYAVLGVKIRKISGLAYTRNIFQRSTFWTSKRKLWIVPDEEFLNILKRYCLKMNSNNDVYYIAPMYAKGAIKDENLVNIINTDRFSQVIITIGGGTQERLGFYLRSSGHHKFGIHCVGAAVGFIIGTQVSISPLADYLGFGWVYRCLSNPRRFLPRYVHALRLIPILIKYRQSPPIV